MKASRSIAVALVAAIGIPCAATSALGQESGTFSAIAAYVRDFTTLEFAGGTYFAGSLEGSVTILASSGDPFVEGRHSLSTCLVLAKRSAIGVDLESPCTIVNPSGDTLYLMAKRSAGDVEAGGGGYIVHILRMVKPESGAAGRASWSSRAAPESMTG